MSHQTIAKSQKPRYLSLLEQQTNCTTSGAQVFPGVAQSPKVGSASIFEIVQVSKSVDVAVGMLKPPPLVANAYQVFPTCIRDGSGKFEVITGPLEMDLFDKGTCSDIKNREERQRII